MKLTEWYPAKIKPVRKGVYETKPYFGNTRNWQYWNGLTWGGLCYDIKRAGSIKNRTFVSRCQSPQWRGVAK